MTSAGDVWHVPTFGVWLIIVLPRNIHTAQNGKILFNSDRRVSILQESWFDRKLWIALRGDPP
jgi:hypothetical protein